jgi:hypothetical protein
MQLSCFFVKLALTSYKPSYATTGFGLALEGVSAGFGFWGFGEFLENFIKLSNLTNSKNPTSY